MAPTTTGSVRREGPRPADAPRAAPTWRALSVALALLVLATAAHAQPYDCATTSPPAFERCAESYARQLIRDHGFPSFSLGVVRGDSVVYARSFGVADRETGAPAGPATLYQLGSVTKMFTGLLFALMVEDGTVRLGDRLADHLPDGVRVPTDADSSFVTLQHLATHSSGLPRFPPNLDRVDGDPILGFTEAELYAGLEASELVFPVGNGREYSNFGYGVLAHALERAAGEPYDALLRRYVLGPLGMDDTGLALTDAQRARLATAYRDDDPTVATEPWDMGAMSGAGGLFSTVEDLARFVAFQTSGADGLGGGALGPHTADALRLVRTPFYRYAQQTEVAYGFGHVVVDWAERDALLVLHNGDVDGYAAQVRFSPDLGVGVIVLTNSGMGQHVGPLANGLMKAALDAYGG